MSKDNSVSAYGDRLENERAELLKLLHESIAPEILDHINSAFSSCEEASNQEIEITISHGGTTDAKL